MPDKKASSTGSAKTGGPNKKVPGASTGKEVKGTVKTAVDVKAVKPTTPSKTVGSAIPSGLKKPTPSKQGSASPLASPAAKKTTSEKGASEQDRLERLEKRMEELEAIIKSMQKQ